MQCVCVCVCVRIVSLPMPSASTCRTLQHRLHKIFRINQITRTNNNSLLTAQPQQKHNTSRDRSLYLLLRRRCAWQYTNCDIWRQCRRQQLFTMISAAGEKNMPKSTFRLAERSINLIVKSRQFQLNKHKTVSSHLNTTSSDF
jgi:hypothetical protein